MAIIAPAGCHSTGTIISKINRLSEPWKAGLNYSRPALKFCVERQGSGRSEAMIRVIANVSKKVADPDLDFSSQSYMAGLEDGVSERATESQSCAGDPAARVADSQRLRGKQRAAPGQSF